MLSNDELDQLAERIHGMEFDHVFTLHPDGSITEPKGIWAPECYHDEVRDIDLCGAEDEWGALTGFTGQYSYNGVVMHSSELAGRRMAGYMLEMAQDGPVTFTVVVVEVLPDEEDEEPEPAGWAILYRKEDS